MATYQFEGQDIVAPFRVTSNEPAFSADTVSLKTRRVKQGPQRWELEFGVTMQDSRTFFADAVSGFHDKLSMTMPQLNVRGKTIAVGTNTTTLKPSTGANAGATSLDLVSSGTGINGTINRGRFVQFSNHDKIYMVKEDFDYDDEDDGPLLKIYPALTTQVTTTTTLKYKDSDNITFKAYRDITNVNGITFTDGVLSEAGTINLIEAL